MGSPRRARKPAGVGFGRCGSVLWRGARRSARMPAEIHVFRCLEDNIGALVHDPGTGACAAIDAPEEAPILAALEEKGWRLSDILVTHRHADHIQGIAPLKARFGCRVVAPAKAAAEVPLSDETVREGDSV